MAGTEVPGFASTAYLTNGTEATQNAPTMAEHKTGECPGCGLMFASGLTGRAAWRIHRDADSCATEEQMRADARLRQTPDGWSLAPGVDRMAVLEGRQ